MTLKVLGSESAGNCYLLESFFEILIIEAGIRLNDVKKALNYDLRKVAACLITHSHGDHCKYADDYMKAGIDIYTSAETIEAASISGHRVHPIQANTIIRIGEFKVIPFPVPHGIPTLGFLINHPFFGSILFVTDAAYISNKFNNLNHILIEANYEDAILTSDRAVGRHMSLDTCLGFLQANDLRQVRNIVLLHLSCVNSNAQQFKKSVQPIAPNSSVWIADKGLEVYLSKHPF
ncbi:MAG: MBL fold metallo-hydrolase [Bacteroidota bacterium]